jgi:hypothetical protein
MLTRLRTTAISLALAWCSSAHAQATDQTQIVDAVRTIFTAAETDDIAKFDAVIARDFYMFDGGMQFNGDDMMALIRAQHAAGKRYEWNVTEPRVRVSGNTAWIAYVNRGSVSDSTGTTPQLWLESAFLEKQTGAWKLVFLHSTRVPVQGTH